MGCCTVQRKDSSQKPASLPQVGGYSEPKLGPEAVFILGGPGAGKGTQCQMLADSGRWVHLSTGDLLREERKQGGPDAEMIENYIKEGKLVPSEMLVKLLRKAMMVNGWTEKKFLIDGYPRNDENIRVWDEMMKDVRIICLLFLECTEETLRTRILSRNEGRSDDNLESLLKRLRVFNEETLPILQKYKERGGRIETISGERSREEVRADILRVLGEPSS